MVHFTPPWLQVPRVALHGDHDCEERRVGIVTPKRFKQLCAQAGKVSTRLARWCLRRLGLFTAHGEQELLIKANGRQIVEELE